VDNTDSRSSTPGGSTNTNGTNDSAMLRQSMGTPDIVVSSVSSDEETESGFGRQTSSDRSYATSDTR
jgi:hypothetical protein